VRILQAGNSVFFSEAVLSDAQPGGLYLWSPFQTSVISEIEATYQFQLLEDDSPDGQTVMGTIDFIPYSSDNDFPDELEFSQDSIAFKLLVEYNW
jgi:hypothetical protein